MDNNINTKLVVSLLVGSIILSSLFGAAAGLGAVFLSANSGYFTGLLGGNEGLALSGENNNTVITTNQESEIIKAVEEYSPAVVSIIVTKDLPVIERYYGSPFGGGFFEEFFGDDFGDFFGFNTPQYREQGTQKREVGGGTGFIVSSDGYIITNKHVVDDADAEYTVLMNDESKYEASVLARDQFNDIAVLKIEKSGLKPVKLGDSANLKVGQTVIAIGNSLGEFRNTVSTGVISGLSRSVLAGGFGTASEQLMGVIQTDASINPGNSGGPLLNIAGEVIGINTAMASGAENIGFAIPVNEIKSIYESVKEHGRIVRPWLGVRYVQINETIKDENRLDVDYGALIVRGETRTELAVVPGSPADKAGLAENDIILEVEGVKINENNPLSRVLSQYKPGQEIVLKILHRGEEKDVKVKLEEME